MRPDFGKEGGVRSDSLVLFVEPGDKKRFPKSLTGIDKALGGRLREFFKASPAIKKPFQVVQGPSFRGRPAGWIVLVGTGKLKQSSPWRVAQAASAAVRAAQDKGMSSVAVLIDQRLIDRFDNFELAQHLGKWTLAGSYHDQRYKTDAKDAVSKLKSIIFSAPALKSKKLFREGLASGVVIGKAVNEARRYSNTPSSELTPEVLAREAQKLAKTSKKISVKVLGEAEIRRMKMGGVLAVAKGSAQPPRFIIIEYRGASHRTKPFVLVGKAVTFDTGGISIKPRDRMDEMKFDMSGGATVLGAVMAIAGLNLKINAVGLIPATENMPSGRAYKPGDIIVMMSGKTVEVIDTDAEGRLLLADALCYAQRFKPRLVVDLATLTGACVIALGFEAAGLMSEDEETAIQIIKASQKTGELVWRLPLWEAYDEYVESDIADLRNVEKNLRWAGAIAGGAFLKKFAQSYRWAHLDIAGTAYLDSPKPYLDKGGTGFGVHLLVDLLRRFKE